MSRNVTINILNRHYVQYVLAASPVLNNINANVNDSQMHEHIDY